VARPRRSADAKPPRVTGSRPPSVASAFPQALDLAVFRQMADMSNDAFYLCDERGRFLYVNERASSFNGYSRDGVFRWKRLNAGMRGGELGTPLDFFRSALRNCWDVRSKVERDRNALRG
jgi:PAS domain-containing protein